MKISSLFKFRKWLAIYLNSESAKKLSDEKYLKMKFYACTGKRLNLKVPQTFNEKIQWLKLYDRNPEYVTMVDKFEAKKWASDIIGEEFVIPALGGPWKSFDEIDFDLLPDQFVLKTTHDCGGVLVCKDKESFDKENARNFLNSHLKRDYYIIHREWPYKNVEPRIFAEEYMSDLEDKEELTDYKFFCFDGVPKAMFIATDRASKTEETKFDFFDMDYNHLPFTQGHPNADKMPQKPKNFEKMKELAAILSKGIPHVRVDFYEVSGKIYIGEMTFSHFSGLVPFNPQEWDLKFGNWIHLEKEKGRI